MQTKRLNGIFFISLLFSSLSFADSKDDIRLNQVGFYTYGPKTAVIVSPQTWYFYIKSTDLRTTFYRGELSATRYWISSADSVKIADFSDFTREGSYVVYVAGIGASYKFTISSKVNHELSKALIRHFYYQRASTDLPSEYAGKWARSGGHFDTKVRIHPSAASAGRTAGQIFSSPKGWYDAGDYGKYIVNAGISTYELLLLYEQFPEYFDTLSLKIPESRNGIPDLLDEIKWEMDWVLTMQDPTDGGVYHKLTGKKFIGDYMPSVAEEERYFIGKSSTATFDFAAICAVAYRIYKKFYPAFADSCLHAAKYAYQWGLNNPKALFKNNPSDVETGEYRDTNADDEFRWASAELYIATDSMVYWDSVKVMTSGYGIPNWQKVNTLGIYSLALVKKDTIAIRKVKDIADGLIKKISNHPFRTTVSSFDWGSNGNVANEGIAILVAFLISKDFKYLEGALHSLDYLLGRNGPGYCFVTGFGTRSVMNPHHRPSIADGIADPVPGFLAGGPNSRFTSGECASAVYPEPSAKKWIDQNCSYSTNEVAINWNAPAAFLASGIEAIFNTSKFSIQPLIDKYGVDSSPVVPGDIVLLDILDDRVTLCWSSSEKTSVSVQYSIDSLMNRYEMILISGSDSNRINITGLMPGKKYYARISWIDKNGNVSSAKTSFTTESSDIIDTEVLHPVVSNYVCGSELSVSFRNKIGISSRLIYSAGGSSVKETLSCSESDGNYSTVIPGERVTSAGVMYSLLLQKDGKTLLTPRWSAGPDSIQLTNPAISSKNTYSMVSLPALFAPVSPVTFLSSSIGDTSTWRFYGYDPVNNVYNLFDTIRSGSGGWIFCKEKTEIEIKGEGLSPDTLFTIVLREGYNCVGNPFAFPVYWNNSVISHDSALIGIADSVSRQFVRQQIFRYEDNTANSKNDGHYVTNRDLISNKYNDSIQLKPWEACWVYAEKDSVVLLLNPSTELNIKSGLAKKQKTGGVEWYYRMSVFSGGGKKEVFLGAASGAKDTYDEYDSPEPPPISSEVQIGFLHPEWNNHKGLYLSDIKSCSGNHEWTISVKSFISGPVNLQWEKNGNHEGYLYLKDLKSGEMFDMSSENSYTYKPEKGESGRNFTISWVPQKQSLNQLQFKSWNFFRERADFPKSQIKFIYSVPSSVQGRTVIEVFDINGRCVKCVLDEKKEPGFYKISWDGKNNSGGIAANGFYVVRLFNSAYNQSIGVHLLR